ncbi:hypothetical protein [Caldimonas sp. KR1-144]|uniref:hypothetical protein n=1 Tax=Caldimonas sp. KR1-144 TaxID=3400911 RepID=UPI003C0CCAF0
MSKKLKLTVYDAAEDLCTEAMIRTFMAEAFETKEPGYVAHALGVAIRARAMKKDRAPGRSTLAAENLAD